MFCYYYVSMILYLMPHYVYVSYLYVRSSHTIKYYVKCLDTCYSATYTDLCTLLQSRKWQLIGMSQ